MAHREQIMENERRNSSDNKEHSDTTHRKDNTEYLATRCRITKPTPPKPATNPMQFVKITPCPLFRKAQEQIKKAEEVKIVRQGIKDDVEDWQANLDNWKSSRRKRQEHIIERVVEVKKFEQQEMEKNRRKSKTFNEILEDRHRRKSKLSISLYETDDSNDLSDYGIGVGQTSSTPYSDTSSNVQTDEEELNAESDSSKCKSPAHSENYERNSGKRDEQNNTWDEKPDEPQKKEMHPKKSWERKTIWEKIEENNIWNKKDEESVKEEWNDENEQKKNHNWKDKEDEQCDEQTKKEVSSWRNNINDTSNNQEQQYTYESAIQDYRTRVKSNLNNGNLFNQLSLKQNTQKMDEEANIIVPKGSILKRKELFENEKLFELNSYESIASRRLCEDFVHSQSLKERLMSLEKYTEQPLTEESNKFPEKTKPSHRSSMLESIKSDLEKNKNNSVINNWDNKGETSDRSSSPETNLFVNKIEKFHCSLENLAGDIDRDGSDCGQSNYPASNSSTELLGLSSQYCDTDREDSGIHTADVSCSVSQADEPVEDTEITTTTLPEKFPTSDCVQEIPVADPIIQTMPWNDNIYTIDNVFTSEEFPLGPPKTALEPPKEKPPPPPMLPDDDLPEEELRRINSTKRIKNELRMKRSSFLGINADDPVDDELNLRKPPDINSFLQKESRLEKQMYKKTQGSYSEAGDSQDSGVELERGRLSTDTWCNSIPDCSTTPVHGREDSEPCTTNSITSEEDEIIKKEREIIELVEKEEQWRGRNDCGFIKPDLAKSRSAPKLDIPDPVAYDTMTESASSIDDEHDEILRVKHELLQLEREEMERREDRKRENIIFQESQLRALEPRNGLKNKRHSLEDISHPLQQHMYMYQPDADYRKSMPELQHEIHMSSYSPYAAHHSGMMSRSMHTSPVKQMKPIMHDHYDRDKYMRNAMDHSDPCLYQPSAMMKHVSRPIARHSLQMINSHPAPAPKLRHSGHEAWLKPRQSQGELRDKFNYSQHWLIQEAEQRRISEQQKYLPPSNQSWKLTRPEKHLPDSVIQTLTQRVQNKVSMSDRNVLGKRMDSIPNIYNPHSPHSVGHAQLHHSHLMEDSQDKMLSVSGKKKCSYCENELGRGAAMIIESLCLFYHMECFKCCVCHVQLGDGLMGTDVRVRNNKLHCHNCYSSDDGVKFSCV